MKTFKMIPALVVLLSAQVAMSGDDIAATFSKQSAWKTAMLYNGRSSIPAYKTGRNTLRVDLADASFRTPSVLNVKVKNGIDWKSICNNPYDYQNNAKHVKEVSMSLVNPLSSQAVYTNSDDGNNAFSLENAENKVRVSNYKFQISYKAKVVMPLLRSVELSVLEQLNDQLKSQESDFLAGGVLKLDLSSPHLKMLACDLSNNLAILSINAQSVGELPKIDLTFWTHSRELEEIYEGLKPLTEGILQSQFRAGINLGRAIGAVKIRTNLSLKERDQRLFNVFYAPAKQKDSFKLKDLSASDLQEAFHELPEMNAPASLEEENDLVINLDNQTEVEGI